MIELLADFLLAMEAVEEDRVALHLRVRDLDGDLAVRCARSVARKMEAMPLRATSAFDAVVIELVAGMEWSHWAAPASAREGGSQGTQRSL